MSLPLCLSLAAANGAAAVAGAAVVGDLPPAAFAAAAFAAVDVDVDAAGAELVAVGECWREAAVLFSGVLI